MRPVNPAISQRAVVVVVTAIIAQVDMRQPRAKGFEQALQPVAADVSVPHIEMEAEPLVSIQHGAQIRRRNIAAWWVFHHNAQAIRRGALTQFVEAFSIPGVRL